MKFKKSHKIALSLVLTKSGMSIVNWTIFMWYLTYNWLAFDSSVNQLLLHDQIKDRVIKYLE